MFKSTRPNEGSGTQKCQFNQSPDSVHLLDVVLKLIVQLSAQGVDTWIRVNDPSAGSPTETLLRLLLPLNDQV
jgi:hypothetical protein